ncbi:hypothetical protein ILYODFUR_014092 [Ilyodon furcidens]|uniref:Uncharacterized protein n=1 Tax=Ilyodon furcidens TaxID=33524 RepID=A0ABV0URU2_9TELE
MNQHSLFEKGIRFQALTSLKHQRMSVHTKIRGEKLMRFKEKLTFLLFDVIERQCFHQNRLRGQTGFPSPVAVGCTNPDLKTNMLLERRPQEKPHKAPVT